MENQKGSLAVKIVSASTGRSGSYSLRRDEALKRQLISALESKIWEVFVGTMILRSLSVDPIRRREQAFRIFLEFRSSTLAKVRPYRFRNLSNALLLVAAPCMMPALMFSAFSVYQFIVVVRASTLTRSGLDFERGPEICTKIDDKSQIVCCDLHAFAPETKGEMQTLFSRVSEESLMAAGNIIMTDRSPKTESTSSQLCCEVLKERA